MNGTVLDAIEHNVYIHDYIMCAVLFSITFQRLKTSARFKIKAIKDSTLEVYEIAGKEVGLCPFNLSPIMIEMSTTKLMLIILSCFIFLF